MIALRKRIHPLFLVLLAAPLLNGCAEFSTNVSKAVWMKHVHVANVRMIQVAIGPSQAQLVGVDNGSFWAVFDICSLDVQGSALTGFNYDASKFFVDTGAVKYGSGTPGTINVASVPMSSQSPQVTTAVKDAFTLSPATQSFPKQFYPNLKYRIAIFIRENPTGYMGESLTLSYDGQPQVAAVVQNVSPGKPEFRPFYNHSVSPNIVGTCP